MKKCNYLLINLERVRNFYDDIRHISQEVFFILVKINEKLFTDKYLVYNLTKYYVEIKQ